MSRSRAAVVQVVLVAALSVLAGAVVPGVAAAAVAPEVPRGVAVRKADAERTATLSWAPPTGDGGSAVTGYLVTRDGVDGAGTGAWSRSLPADARSFVFRNLVADSRYRLTVQAVNAEGAGRARSASVTIGPGLRFVSDLPFTSSTNGLGPVERDRGNGGSGAADGGVLTVAGRTFAKGLGVHAASDVRVRVPAGCSRFTAVVGVDDAVGDTGSVVFQVFRGTAKAYDSGVRTGASPAATASVPVTAGSVLRLVVTPGTDGTASDAAGWGDARLLCAPAAGVVATGFTTPWSLVPLPGGGALVGERTTARVKRVAAGGAVTTVGTVRGVASGGEAGLLGLALSPAFATDRLLYAFVSTSTDNRVVRMRLETTWRLGAPQPVLTGIPRGPQHNGGRIAFGPDGHLYVATGDNGVEPPAQNPAQQQASLAGKILRVTRDGAPAPGNPFPGSPVYSIGHRNVQGLAFDGSGRLFATELGDALFDEVNRILPGRNYGWPVVEGPSSDARFTNPVAAWDPADASPSGATVVGSSLYAAGLRGERLLQVPLPGTVGAPSYLVQNRFGRLRDVGRVGGVLWALTDEGAASRVVRVAAG